MSVIGPNIIVTVAEGPNIPSALLWFSNLRIRTATPSVAEVKARLMKRKSYSCQRIGVSSACGLCEARWRALNVPLARAFGK